MTENEVIDDIYTGIDTYFTFGNVTGLAAKSYIAKYEINTMTSQTNGLIFLWKVKRVSENIHSETYVVDGYIKYIDDSATPSMTTINELVTEVTRCLDETSKESGGEYKQIHMNSELKGNKVFGIYKITITAVRVK